MSLGTKKIITGERIILYEGWTETESGFGECSLGFFLECDHATAAVKGKGAWGSDGKTRLRDGFREYLSNDEVRYFVISPIEIDNSVNDVELRKQALAKLTPAEIKLLNIKV